MIRMLFAPWLLQLDMAGEEPIPVTAASAYKTTASWPHYLPARPCAVWKPVHGSPRHAARPSVMLRVVAASRKWPQNGLSPKWLDCATGARNDPVEDPAL